MGGVQRVRADHQELHPDRDWREGRVVAGYRS